MEGEKRAKNKGVTGSSLAITYPELDVVPLLTGTNLQNGSLDYVQAYVLSDMRSRHACSQSQTRASHFLSSFFFSRFVLLDYVFCVVWCDARYFFCALLAVIFMLMTCDGLVRLLYILYLSHTRNVDEACLRIYRVHPVSFWHLMLLDLLYKARV